MAEVHTTCRICQQKCGLTVTIEGGRIKRIGPDKEHPLSWRDFCVKGRAAGELVHHPRRITTPMRRCGDRYLPATYGEAYDDIATRLARIVGDGGADSVGCFYGNPAGFHPSALGGLLRFMMALGSSNLFNWASVDTNAKTVTCGEMYGVTLLPLIPDVDACDCLLLVGANPAESKMNWASSVPNGWRRILDRVDAGADLLVVDPYRTPTAARATMHLRVRPGEDWALLLGMVKTIFDERLEDAAACSAESGGDDLRTLAAEVDWDVLTRRSGVAQAVIEDAGRRFGAAETAIALARTGPSQTTRGTLALWLTEVLGVITGNWDRPGGRYFQRGFAPVELSEYAPEKEPRARLTGRPAIGGCHPLADLPAEILTPGPGQIRALFVEHGNPVVAGPDGANLDRALADLDLLVCVDMVQRESHRHADWLIPGTHWLERDELVDPLFATFNELPFVQFTPMALPPPVTVREEWAFYQELGATLGLAGYVRDQPADFEDRWREAVEGGNRTTWDEVRASPHGIVLGTREFGYARSMLKTPGQRIRLAPRRFLDEARRQAVSHVDVNDGEFPFFLGNRRRLESMNSHLNDLPSIRRLLDGNGVEIHQDDAVELGISTGDMVRISSPTANIDLGAVVSANPRPGTVIIEHGWGSRVFDPVSSQTPDVVGVNRNLLTSARHEDPLSYMSGFNDTRVAVRRVDGPSDDLNQPS
ncbi:molybdopterin-containing oxidoreductase family protein [Mycolicibacter sinensis]|uniref:Oxidoreductase n=1 Tax=Mycolicibacter sinensis (strain JDM601) TaxID=875328 RepID=A0A1A3U0N1_MYCSD|nr:molybdopterin-dependent oxidoreductase [Mycolicibacter sinensis]OBK88438.1 oxidoreductase [Mycolicibacter sinensis]